MPPTGSNTAILAILRSSYDFLLHRYTIITTIQRQNKFNMLIIKFYGESHSRERRKAELVSFHGAITPLALENDFS